MFDLTTFKELALAALPLAGLITGLTQVVKQTLALSDRFVPIAAVIVGAGLGVVLIQMSVLGAIVGLSVGLSSIGMWEVGKTTIAGISTKNELSD